MKRKPIIMALAALLCLAPGVRPAAQDDVPAEGVPIGMIPGTQMTHDEFRARAQAQLDAVALNALTYRVLNGAYPANYYDLYNSDSWNLDVTNIFTGRPVDAILFTPTAEDMTSSADVGLPFDVEMPPPVTPQQPGGTGDQGNAPGDQGGQSDQGGQGDQNGISVSPVQLYFRVDPAKVDRPEPGNIFYYTDGDMLQLIMYAPDGVYCEHYDVTPNGRWAAKIGLLQIGEQWQQDVMAAEVLFFAGEMLPQYYNSVQFMSDKPTTTHFTQQQIDPATCQEMASSLGITILNPSSKQPIGVGQTYSRGDFVQPAAGGDGTLAIWLQNGSASTLDQLYAAYSETSEPQQPPAQRKPKPSAPSGAPPLGGRR